jgi:hypothetical protein
LSDDGSLVAVTDWLIPGSDDLPAELAH